MGKVVGGICVMCIGPICAALIVLVPYLFEATLVCSILVVIGVTLTAGIGMVKEGVKETRERKGMRVYARSTKQEGKGVRAVS